MTNEELLAKTSAARGLAHRSPFGEWSKDHKGHSSIVNHTHAFAERGEDFIALTSECERRGLKIPPCDCPAEAHDWERPKCKLCGLEDGACICAHLRPSPSISSKEL